MPRGGPRRSVAKASSDFLDTARKKCAVGIADVGRDGAKGHLSLEALNDCSSYHQMPTHSCNAR